MFSKVIVFRAANACIYLRVVTSGHVNGEKKMAVMPFDPPYSKTTCKPDGSIFYRTGVVGDQSLHCWNKNVGRYRLR